mmetsp:Transcript_32551/g.114520  ORF Transcript_32551/g.114520 Transcript_32551/m.114520 type:complete len:219 (-) Transcript_32551:8-664(-)
MTRHHRSEATKDPFHSNAERKRPLWEAPPGQTRRRLATRRCPPCSHGRSRTTAGATAGCAATSCAATSWPTRENARGPILRPTRCTSSCRARRNARRSRSPRPPSAAPLAARGGTGCLRRTAGCRLPLPRQAAHRLRHGARSRTRSSAASSSAAGTWSRLAATSPAASAWRRRLRRPCTKKSNKASSQAAPSPRPTSGTVRRRPVFPEKEGTLTQGSQ